MSYYFSTAPNGRILGVWKIESHIAERIDVTGAENRSPGTYFEAEPGSTIWDTIRRQASDWFEPDGQCPFHQMDISPGEYYPRMARPTYHHDGFLYSPSARNNENLIANARGQLTALTRHLDRICQTVQPTKEMLCTFGHDIRNLLILACTEAEMYWRGVLVANRYDPMRKHYDTKDYVKLCLAMRLNEYAISFPNYPWLVPFMPYKGWKSGKPTQSMKWYSAYNAVKHNRETEFQQATLLHAFEAISACVIMMIAQFGSDKGLCESLELSTFFSLSTRPDWPLSCQYSFPYNEAGWAAVHFPFN
jgi:hypothetical protein